MSSNCTVLKDIGSYLARRRYNLSPKSFDASPLIARFNELTGCATVIPCEVEEVCDMESTVVCNILLTQTDYIIDPAGYVTASFYLFNAKQPYTIEWFYGEPQLISGQGTDTLKVRADYNHMGGNFQIVAQVIDGLGCKAEVSKTSLVPRAEIHCNSITFNGGPLYEGVPFTGTFTVAYIDGNGKSYSALTPIPSTGITGLVATLAAGTLASGAGTLTFNVTGTPIGVGTATFPLSLFGTSCVAAIGVADIADLCAPVPIGYSTEFYNYASGNWIIKLLWGPGGVDYDLTYTISGTPTTITIAAPTYYKYITVPPSTAFSASLVANCDITNSSVPTTFSASTAASPAPPTCPVVTGFTIGTTVYDSIAGDYVYPLSWTAAAGAVGYHIVTPSGNFDVTGTNASVHLQAGGTRTVTFSTHCGNGNYSNVLINNITVPAVPLPVNPPNMRILHNIGTSPNFHLQTWFTTDHLVYGSGVELMQGPLFGAYASNSGVLTIGTNNGYTPLPGGFGADDIYFNSTAGLPVGYPILGTNMSKLKVKLNKTSSLSDTFEYWMNIPQSLGLRQDLVDDYIPMFSEPGSPRPVLTLGALTSTSAVINFSPNGLNYDACSTYNMFLMAPNGAVITATPASYTPHTYTFIGLTSGTTYTVFFEMTYNACITSPIPWKTASPIMITTP